jgi:class 3 adenylate cyclase
MGISPTLEGFRVAFRRPSLTLAEIMWRWTAGAAAAALLLFGLIEYLDTLPVTNGELLFLRTRQPYLVSEAIAHILRGSLSRAMTAAIVAAFLLAMLWIFAATAGRIATVRALLDYFRRDVAGVIFAGGVRNDGERDVASNASTTALFRLNFLRAAVVLAAVLGFIGAAILAGFASPDADPRPGLAFFLFLPLAVLIWLVWGTLNWLLSLAGMFAVRDGEDAMGSISAAVTLCRERTGPVAAVSFWTGLAHTVAFVGATMVAFVPLGFAGVVPWRLVVLVVMLVTLAYFALADWLYMARLAGYVCIAEMPEAVWAPPLPAPPTIAGPPVQATLVQTTIDRDEPILSDLPNLAVET